jgi:hypothetical protein
MGTIPSQPPRGIPALFVPAHRCRAVYTEGATHALCLLGTHGPETSHVNQNEGIRWRDA